MHADYFRDILVAVIGGLGIFMLGLEFMSNGIQNLAVNKMRALLARIAGTPIKGVLAGTLITGRRKNAARFWSCSGVPSVPSS